MAASCLARNRQCASVTISLALGLFATYVVATLTTSSYLFENPLGNSHTTQSGITNSLHDLSSGQTDVPTEREALSTPFSVAALAPAVRSALRARIACWTHGGSWVDTGAPVPTSDDPDPEPYTWIPTGGCPDSPFRPFNKSAFCDVLRGRHVHLIGDSTTRDYHSALQSTLRVDHYIGRLVGHEYGRYGYGFRNDSFICADKPKGRSRLLLFSQNRFHSRDGMIKPPVSVADYLNLSAQAGASPEIVLLNRGLHFSGDHEFLSDVSATFQSMGRQHPQALVLWRSMTPPHPFCMEHTRPIPSPQPWAQLDEAPKGRDYHYSALLTRQVPMLRNLIENDTWPGVIYLDITSPMALRPDVHGSPKDCVHYARPRYHNIWTRLLYNILVEIDEISQRLSSRA